MTLFLSGCISPEETETGICTGNIWKYFNLSDGTYVTVTLSTEPTLTYTYKIQYANGSAFECPCWMTGEEVECVPGRESESNCYQTILKKVRGYPPIDC